MNYLAIEHTNLDEGTSEIHVYRNKRGGIFWERTMRYPKDTFFESFTDVIAEVYKHVPKSLGHNITVERIYK